MKSTDNTVIDKALKNLGVILDQKLSWIPHIEKQIQKATTSLWTNKRLFGQIWAKIGEVKFICLIGRDVLCYGNGCFAMFYNLSDQEEKMLVANSPSGNGDGINEVRGHKTTNVFAYAENCINARIFVKNYPHFETINILYEAASQGYISMTFAETSLLITLEDLPKFSVTVWNWRSNKKLGQADTHIYNRKQKIRCNWNKPVYMVQFGEDTKEISYWDLFTCCKEMLICQHQVKVTHMENLSPFTHAMWTTEGGLFLCDKKGNVYTVDQEFSLEKVIEVDLIGTCSPSITWYKGGITVSGPDTVVRHYKKSGIWSCDWTINLEQPLYQMISVRSDYLLGTDEDGEIIKINENHEVSFLSLTSMAVTDICMVYPMGDYVVALRKNITLIVFEIATAQQMSMLTLTATASSINANPNFPYLTVSCKNGVLQLVSIFNPSKMTFMCSFHLTHNPIEKIKYFERGRILVTAYLQTGDMFIIEGLPGTSMKVVAHIEIHQQITDYILVASKTCFRLYVLPVTSKYLAGNKIIRYCIVDKNTVNVKEYFFEQKDVLYCALRECWTPNRDRVFYAVPFYSTSLHEVETRRGDNICRVRAEIKTGHQINDYQIRIKENICITWGFGGFALVRDSTFVKQIAIVTAHHRYQGGVKVAYVDLLGRYVVTLGREGVMCCTKLNNTEIDESLLFDLTRLVRSDKFSLMFKRPTYGFKPEGAYANKTWVEVYEIEKAIKEEAICREEKAEIWNEFHSIQSTLNFLVTRHLEGPEIERIEFLEFYLDTTTYNQKKQKNREECKHTEIYLKALIDAQNVVTEYLKKTYWEPMGVRGKVVRGIFQKTIATIYTLLPNNAAAARRLAWVEEQRKIEEFLSVNCIFEPWLKVPPEVLVKQLKFRPKFTNQDYNTIQARGLFDDTTSQLSIESQIALVGSVVQLYVERNPWHYKQRQLVSFYQCDLQQAIAEAEVVKLKQQYNVTFNALAELKLREMENIKDKHERLRHIISEYNFFTDNKIFFEIEDPEWTQEEEPTLILVTNDNELSVTPYISPSKQAILDAKAAEEERIRLALLADDFKERALMVMMNGVLEIKWEDEIKKDVPLPKCMLEKDPEEFNEEDLRAIRDYEEKVIFLASEREKYKHILEVDFSKITTGLRDSIRKFNQKTKDSVEYKMYIDSGMNQENLRINRARLQQNERIKLYEKEETFNELIAKNEEDIERIQESVKRLNEAIGECKTNLENLLLKEKTLEKSFKRDFQEYSTVVQEQAMKLYKKRPRVNFRSINTEAVLLELAKCVITQEKSLILTPECFDYLKSLDNLDEFVGLPPTIDESTFRLVCKQRRSRIEFEMKVKAAQMQITDGEATIAQCQKRLSIKKEKNSRLISDVKRCKVDYLYLMHNIQIQIVVRRGLVEIPLTGDLYDFKDAMLVPKREIEQINALIKAAGNTKLKTIRQNMAFRRRIMVTEWEHKKLRMTINDLIEQMNDINGTKFLRDMQSYMKSKSMGRKTDIDTLEQEIEIIAAMFENNMRERREKLLKVEKQVYSYREHNKNLDKAIQDLNIDICALRLKHDDQLDDVETKASKARMEGICRRSELVQTIQKNHNEILVLQTELELLRLRTYPTFKYKLINTEEKI